MEHRSMDYVDLDAELASKGYPFLRSQEVLEAVASEYGLLDRHGECTRPFSAILRAEVYQRLGPPPKKTGRPPKGPAVKCRLTPEEAATLTQAARERGVDRSNLITQIVRAWLHAPDGPDKCINCGASAPADDLCDNCASSVVLDAEPEE